MLEYFIATPGARKGLVDTALRTADSGYLTRRLVDVAQELIIREPDCQRDGEPVRGLWIEDVVPDTRRQAQLPRDPHLRPHAGRRREALATAPCSRPATRSARSDLDALRDDPDGRPGAGALACSPASATSASAPPATAARWPPARRIELGEAVGVIAAQSIGEPGTQLTMRTFHTGGIAGTDIAGGLPRVVELFEARSPKGKATLARTSGVVRIADDEGKGRVITIVGDDGDRGRLHRPEPRPPRGHRRPGDHRRRPDRRRSPRSRRSSSRSRASARPSSTSSSEVQKVYRDQGVSIHDKHIELIVRQMTRRVARAGAGRQSDFLPGERGRPARSTPTSTGSSCRRARRPPRAVPR